MFFAAPVQNLTLPRAQVAPRPLFEPFLVSFCLFWPFQASDYRILTQHPILTLGDPTSTGRGAPRPCYITYWCPLLVVEGFSQRLSLLLCIPADSFGLLGELFPLPSPRPEAGPLALRP